MMRTFLLAALLGVCTCFAPVPSRVTPSRSRSAVSMKVGLVYSTTTGNTENVAAYISAEVGVDAVDIGDLDDAAISEFDGLICGAPTWHTGADTERSGTAWDEFLYDGLESANVKGKKVAIFGLGDQAGYADNFVDAMDELASCFKKSGAKIVGATSTDGYDHQESKSVAGGKFVGLACDEDNQPDLSEERCQAWVAQIKGEGMAV